MGLSHWVSKEIVGRRKIILDTTSREIDRIYTFTVEHAEPKQKRRLPYSIWLKP